MKPAAVFMVLLRWRDRDVSVGVVHSVVVAVLIVVVVGGVVGVIMMGSGANGAGGSGRWVGSAVHTWIAHGSVVV